MKSLDKMNFKKIVPSIVSFVIIAGMAFSTLATNVDMEAFIGREEYRTKFNEIEFRIGDIDTELERLYKFTCTNVQSFGGGGALNSATSRGSYPFYYGSYNSAYHWQNRAICDFSEEGYLRFNAPRMINFFGNHGKTDKLTYTIPGSLCSWREGIECTPDTMVRYDMTRTWRNQEGVDSSLVSSVSVTVTMGPFKKLPNITTTGASRTQGNIVALPQDGFQNYSYAMNIYYAENSPKEPTSWTSDANGRISQTTYNRGNAAGSTFPVPSEEDIVLASRNLQSPFVFYISTLTSKNLSTLKENCWLRFTYSNTQPSIDILASLDTLVLTSWNHNK